MGSSQEIWKLLHEGTVIPAHPLALTSKRTLDEDGQRLLTRYYMASGAGGIAVGVHTTQFQIREPQYNLFEKVLSLAIDEIKNANLNRPFIKVAGICGPINQAVEEARLARDLGYDIGLLSINGLGEYSEAALLARAEKVGQEIPLLGFYLQTAVGGKMLSFDYWKNFSEIPAVHGIKMAPFNRYQTLEVVQAVCHSSRAEEIALYTGNDDNILIDLLSTYVVNTPHGEVKKEIVGGLLGHWAVWTSKAVALLKEVKGLKKTGLTNAEGLLTEAIKITDSNSAFFDSKNNFKGCIAGIHEVLKRQGLMKGVWCLDPEEGLSPGQSEEIDRVYREYPHLHDDAFVQDHIDEWIKGLPEKS